MNNAKIPMMTLLAALATSFSNTSTACCPAYEVEYVVDALAAQQAQLDEAARRKRQERRDAEYAQKLAEQELADRRARTLAEQYRLADEAARRKNQIQRDAELAQRIAEQELADEKARIAREQQYIYNEATKKREQERRDAEYAQRLAAQELAAQKARTAAEQQYLLDQAAKTKRQVDSDAAYAQRLAAQEVASYQNSYSREQQRTAQEKSAKEAQIASDAMLAQQLYAEELAAAYGNGNKSSSRPTVTTPMATSAVSSVSSRDAALTTALPTTMTASALQSWIQTNNIMPSSIDLNDPLCAVCISTADELKGNKVVKLPCKHVFCTQCAASLASGKTDVSCPTCRDKSGAAAVQRLVR